MERLNVKSVSGFDMLIGKSDGQRDLPKLAAAVVGAPDGATLAWDWSGVRVATASYFASTYVPLLKMVVSGELDRYFILVGMNKNCEDELRLVLDAQGLPTLIAQGSKGGRIREVRVIGKLDSAHAETLERIIERPGASATDLHEHACGKGRIGKTAWINRLTALNRYRLVRRRKAGREYVFEPVHIEG